MATTFSRLQLAAALLEYDNDLDDPAKPRRNAKESAIFAHLRQTPQPRYNDDEDDDDDDDVPLRRGSVNQLARNSGLAGTSSGSYRRSAVPDVVGEEKPRGDDGTRVLSEWGLEAFAPTDVETDAERESKAAQLKHLLSIRERTHSEALPNPHGPPSPVGTGAVNTSPIRRFPVRRPLSMGDLDDLVIGESPERTRDAPTVMDYRKSMHPNLDFSPHIVFPQESPLDDSPQEGENFNSIAFPVKNTPLQTPQAVDENPFAVPLPSPDRVSRFDPKVVEEERRRSIGSSSHLTSRVPSPSDAAARRLSIGSMGSRFLMPDDMSHVPAKPRSRTTSMGTMGTRLMAGDVTSMHPLQSVASPPEEDDRRLSRLNVLRPKLLVMPSPLQDTLPRESKTTPEGFFRSESGIPLPPGSRPEARPGTVRAMSALVPSQSFNPRMSMSLSQLTFRQSLMVGGQRDPSYADLDHNLRRAENDGERVDEFSEPEEEVMPVDSKGFRPAGKLYGKSLIDNLEARKAMIKGQQRVFTGDERPSMMSRPAMAPRRHTGDTLIDPNELSRPQSTFLSPAQVQDDVRKKRASGMPGPLLNFDNSAAGLTAGPSRAHLPNSRSVFGVDTVWERELAKLRAAEEAERAEQGKLDALDARIADQKNARPSAAQSTPDLLDAGTRSSSFLAASSSSPGDLKLGSPLGPQQMSVPKDRRQSVATLGAQGWFNGGSDEEDDMHDKAMLSSEHRLLYNRKVSAPTALPHIPSGGLGNLNDSDEDEDEDVPLAQQSRRSQGPAALQRRTVAASEDSDSEEDKPIGALKRQTSLNLPVINFNKPTNKDGESSDDDEVPLAVRHPTASRFSSMLSTTNSGGNIRDDNSDEDDKPLGATYRASTASFNLQAMQQQQQQQLLQQQMIQQQMLLQTQAQMRASMAFGHAMASPMLPPGPAFGVPFPPAAPMSMHSLNAPAVVAAQAQAAAQHSRVDQWRKDIV